MITKSPYTVTRACFPTLWHIAAEEDFITAKNLQIQELERILIIGLPGRDKKNRLRDLAIANRNFCQTTVENFYLNSLILGSNITVNPWKRGVILRYDQCN